MRALSSGYEWACAATRLRVASVALMTLIEQSRFLPADIRRRRVVSQILGRLAHLNLRRVDGVAPREEEPRLGQGGGGVCEHAHAHARTHTHAHTCTCTYTHEYTCTNTRARTRIYTSDTFTFTYTHAHVRTHTRADVQTCRRADVQTYTRACPIQEPRLGVPRALRGEGCAHRAAVLEALHHGTQQVRDDSGGGGARALLFCGFLALLRFGRVTLRHLALALVEGKQLGFVFGLVNGALQLASQLGRRRRCRVALEHHPADLYTSLGSVLG